MKQIWLVLLLSISATLSAQDDTTLSQVNTRNGYVYKNNVRFTGVLYSDKSASNECKCTLEASYLNGKLNGLKKEWYENGKVKYIGNYKEGKLFGTAKRYDINGNLIIEKSFLSDEEVVLFALNAFPRTSYTDDLLLYYLRKFDVNYNNYKNNQFEIERKKNILKQNIADKVNNINFNREYKSEGTFNLSNYLFQEKRFNFRNLDLNKNIAGFSFFYKQASFGNSNNKDIFSSRLNISFVNSNDFMSLNIDVNLGEQLVNRIGNNKLYYEIDYTILKVTAAEILANTKVHYAPRIPAYISKMRIYSDINKTNLIRTIYANTSLKSTLSNYKNINKNGNTNNLNKKSNNSFGTIPKENISTKSVSSLDNLLKKAEAGDKYAQNEMGLYYFDGKNTLKDITKAKFWFEKAAINGNVTSQENLGAIYFEEKNFSNAIIWYTKAANANHSRAQYVLGFMHKKGIGTKKSRRNAKKWWKKSCSLGYSQSCDEVKKMNALGNAILNSVNESINKK